MRYEVAHIADQGLNPLWEDEKIDRAVRPRVRSRRDRRDLAPGTARLGSRGTLPPAEPALSPGSAGSSEQWRTCATRLISDQSGLGRCRVQRRRSHPGGGRRRDPRQGRCSRREFRGSPRDGEIHLEVDSPIRSGVAMRSIWWNAWDPLTRDSSTRPCCAHPRPHRPQCTACGFAREASPSAPARNQTGSRRTEHARTAGHQGDPLHDPSSTLKLGATPGERASGGLERRSPARNGPVIALRSRGCATGISPFL